MCSISTPSDEIGYRTYNARLQKKGFTFSFLTYLLTISSDHSDELFVGDLHGHAGLACVVHREHRSLPVPLPELYFLLHFLIFEGVKCRDIPLNQFVVLDSAFLIADSVLEQLLLEINRYSLVGV